jgi:apolipoprotein N-acyltransferase
LFYLVREGDARQGFWLGLAFGYGQFGVGVSWVYVSLHTYGGMPLWMGSIAVLLFAGILAIFVGLTVYCAARLVPQGGILRLLSLASAWVFFEWLKSWIFTGFPWLELGYTQTPLWLFSLAPIGGVYLLSFAVALTAACLVALLQYKYRLLPLTALATIVFLAWISSSLTWSTPSGKELSIGLVQANVEINEKWQANNRNNIITRLSALSQKLTQQSKVVDLIVWPETALPLYYQQTDSAFWHQIVSPETALLTGLLDNPQSDKIYNAAVLSCQGQQMVYRKRHLVPFGEYLPMRFLFNWVLDYLQLPMSDLASWQGTQVLSCGDDINIGLSICYEDAFASEMRRYAGDATLLVNISEDAWFGDSLAPHQRLQMAQMRARELARPLLRSANTGPSVVINELGEVLARTPQFVEHTLQHTVQPQTGDTPYKRFGNWIVWLCMLMLGKHVLRNY